jgi:hypothetical protein
MGNDIMQLDKDAISQLEKHCVRIAKSGLVPAHFAENPSAIYTAISMAKALGEVPETLMQHIYFVSGRAGLSAAYMLSRLQRTHAIKGTVRYLVRGEGKTLAVRAVAVDAETGEEVTGPEVSMAMAEAEGWVKNPKYKSMPEVMLRKRAVAFLARDHYPGALMGFLTVEEVEDVVRLRGAVHATVVDREAPAAFLRAASGEPEPALEHDAETGEVAS